MRGGLCEGVDGVLELGEDDAKDHQRTAKYGGDDDDHETPEGAYTKHYGIRSQETIPMMVLGTYFLNCSVYGSSWTGTSTLNPKP